MDYRKNFINNVRKIMKEKKPKEKDIKRKIGLSPSTVHKMKSGDLNIQLNSVFLFSEYAGVTPDKLFAAPEEEKETQEVPNGLGAVIEAFSYLKPEERSTAMAALNQTIELYQKGREQQEAAEAEKLKREVAAASIKSRGRLV